MEDQIASFKDRVHEKLIGYFRPSQEGNQQKSSLEDETRLILFIYLCFNCLMFTMVSLKIFIYWVAVNVLVFVFLKYFFVEQRPEMTFDAQFGRQVRTQTFFEGGYNEESKVNEIKPKAKSQQSDKNDKESYVLKESKSSVKKRSIYAMDLPAESNHLQKSTQEKSFRHSSENVQKEQPSFHTERDPVDEKKNTMPKTSLLLKIKGSISNLKSHIARKNRVESTQVESNKKSLLSFLSFSRFVKRKREEKESIKADEAPMEIEEEEVQEIPKNKEEKSKLFEIPKEKEDPKEAQEETVNKRSNLSQDFQNQVIQELMKQMGGKNLSQLIAPKQEQKQQQLDINKILNDMESDFFDRKGQDKSNLKSVDKPAASVPVKNQAKPLKEPARVPQTFANSQRTKVTNKEDSSLENIDKSLNQPKPNKSSLQTITEEQNHQKPPIQSQNSNKSIEALKSTKTKARLAYIDDDSEEENEAAKDQNLNETQTEAKNYQASFTLGEQNANNESVPEESSQPQDSEYESVSFGGPNPGKSLYFAHVFADRPLREIEVETKPQDEVEIRSENEVPYENNFGIQLPGNNETQDWGQNAGGLNQASFFNNLGDYFKTDSWNNNEPSQPEAQYEENQTSEPYVVDQNSTQYFNNNQEVGENPEENNSMYHHQETSYQNFNDENEEEEQNNSLLLVKQNKNKQVNNSFSAGAGGLANTQKKGFLGRRGLASGSSFALSNKNAK